MSNIGDRIAASRVGQARVAALAGLDPTVLSRYLSGSRRPRRPDEVWGRVTAALDALEEAEVAAEEARRRVLAEHACRHRIRPHSRRRGCHEAPHEAAVS